MRLNNYPLTLENRRAIVSSMPKTGDAAADQSVDIKMEVSLERGRLPNRQFVSCQEKFNLIEEFSAVDQRRKPQTSRSRRNSMTQTDESSFYNNNKRESRSSANNNVNNNNNKVSNGRPPYRSASASPMFPRHYSSPKPFSYLSSPSMVNKSGHQGATMLFRRPYYCNRWRDLIGQESQVSTSTRPVLARKTSEHKTECSALPIPKPSHPPIDYEEERGNIVPIKAHAVY